MLRLELGRRTFAPSLAATLSALLLLALLLSLGAVSYTHLTLPTIYSV